MKTIEFVMQRPEPPLGPIKPLSPLAAKAQRRHSLAVEVLNARFNALRAEVELEMKIWTLEMAKHHPEMAEQPFKISDDGLHYQMFLEEEPEETKKVEQWVEELAKKLAQEDPG